MKTYMYNQVVNLNVKFELEESIIVEQKIGFCKTTHN